MKIEIDTDTFDFAYENKDLLKMVNHFRKLCDGEDDGLNGKQLLEASQKEQALNDFRTRAWKLYGIWE